MKSKKEFVDSLGKNTFKRVSKDLICRTFHQETKTIYESLRKQELVKWEERNKWYWEKFFLLIQVKFDVTLLHSENPYYFLAKRTRAKAVKKEDREALIELKSLTYA